MVASRRLVARIFTLATLSFAFIVKVSAGLTEDEFRMIALSKARQQSAFAASGKTWQFLGEVDARPAPDFPLHAERTARDWGGHLLEVLPRDVGGNIRYFHTIIPPYSHYGFHLRLSDKTLVVLWRLEEETRNMDLRHVYAIKDDQGFMWSSHTFRLQDILGVTTDLLERPL